MSHPSSEIEKEYRVDTQQPIASDLLDRYKEGIIIEGERYRLKSYKYKTPRSVRLTLIEGKNREIRKVFAHWHIGVRKIHRIRIGIVQLRSIPSGQYRPLTQREVQWFIDASSSGGNG